MLAIGGMTIFVAGARLLTILLCHRWYGLAWYDVESGLIDTLTEIEAIVACCAACLPAMRVYIRRKSEVMEAKSQARSNNSQWESF